MTVSVWHANFFYVLPSSLSVTLPLDIKYKDMETLHSMLPTTATVTWYNLMYSFWKWEQRGNAVLFSFIVSCFSSLFDLVTLILLNPKISIQCGRAVTALQKVSIFRNELD